MKKLILISFLAVMFIGLIYEPVQAQSITVIKADTIGNSQSHTKVLDLATLGHFDSLSVGLYVRGEADLDSLDVQGGVNSSTTIKGSSRTFDAYEQFSSTKSQTLTVDVADSVETLVENVVTITAAELKGYNSIQFKVISASSGNDSSDLTEMYALYVKVYRHYTYQRNL